MADIKIYGRLVSGTASKELAKADEISIEAIDGVEATTVQDALEEIASSSGGYEPPVGGIPKTDLASDVQTSLGKADTALQPAALNGYATTSDVTDAINDLVDGAPQALDTLKEIADKLGDEDDAVAALTSALGGKQDTISDLATIRTNSGKGIADMSSNADGTVVTTLVNGDTYTVNLNHEHPQYAESEDLADVATSGSYNDLTDKPVIPEGADLSGYYDKDDVDDLLDGKVDKASGQSLMTDAERTKLQGIAAGAEVNVQPNWTQTNTSADDYIKNKPTLSTVATSGSYNDLDDKPVIPEGADLSGYYTKTEIDNKGFINKAMYYGTSTSDAATMPKVCTVDTFPTYTDNGVTHAKEGTIIGVKFTNSDTNTTDAPTLNVNGIGAKAIMYNNAIITSTAKNTTVAGYTKQIAYYRYDPELDEGNGAWEYLGKSVDSNSTYSNASLGQGYATQTNSAAATAITASISSYSLSTGGIVSVKFTYDVPASATLNINSKGAKAIYNKGAAITAGVIKAGDTATFIYSTYYHLIAVDSWQDKQDAISDLATIRSGAALGASALQSYTETDPTVPAWAKASTKPTYTAQEVGALPSTTTIPTDLGDLTNNAGYVKYVLLADEAAYEALATKDSSTLYLIPES